jgi:hypothetical protein
MRFLWAFRYNPLRTYGLTVAFFCKAGALLLVRRSLETTPGGGVSRFAFFDFAVEILIISHEQPTGWFQSRKRNCELYAWWRQ